MSSWHRLAHSLILVQLCHGIFFKEFFSGRRRCVGMMPPPPPEAITLDGCDPVIDMYFPQRLDHFNDTLSGITWPQRYQVNQAVYKKGGPIFVLVGGEGFINGKWLTYGQVYQNAVKYGALLFQLEHRFYGQTRPTYDLSIKNLRYLNTAQALADLEAFIRRMKEMYCIPDAKVVIFGGSYSGNLAIWHRVLYPNSSVGAVASSAPIMAQEDFTGYLETVGRVQKYFHPDCYNAVQEAFKRIQDLIKAKNTKQLKSLFGICGTPLNYSDPFDVQAFYSQLIEPWMAVTQYSAVGNASMVATYCRSMTNESFGDPLHRYAKWFKRTGSPCVFHDYQQWIDELKRDTWDSLMALDGTRQWMWQTCTEFGYYQSTCSKNQPFGDCTVGITFLEEIYCTGIFGITSKEISQNIAALNAKYGGKDPNVTNVFFLNGSFDPWHPLSVFEHDLNNSSFTRFIEGTSHCYDMYEVRPDDPPSLSKARQDVTEALARWLA